MKKVSFILFLSLMSLASAFAQNGYPMTCVFDGTQTVSISSSLTQPRKLVVGFSFKRANKPATMGVEPGTCAWDDRPMYNDEPNNLAQITDDAMTYFEINHKGTTQLVMVPVNAYWAPQAYTRGYKIRFKVFQSGPNHGYAINYFQVVN